ncbi:MAG: FAD-linked oxidase C-terminal domain-containing protein [Humidesulfovibrio sp.]|uniref:FAD-binding oxidoreductase n=1 Tax=Humidesulfovibrio sp. TaxID=2910988 RepID=UPI0027340B00|nr:FAD-linked oxidase C-terminal domain-containing protein [Humidesulfovibrio sp.]MDP2847734.1 FAD-linked oxidase C-terminal domain-containing protein [Humidesulfovibrio sp.]
MKSSTSLATALTPAHLRFLESLFPGEGLVTDPTQMAVYGADSSRRSAMPWAVVRPRTEEQVVELLTWAESERVPLVPRARGTGMSGGAVPAFGGVVVSSLWLNCVLDIDADDFCAEVEPGVVTAEFQALTQKQKLFYPPDPASLKISTLGGNVATCAGGMRAVKYGVTRDYVLGVRAVLPGGRIVNAGGRSHKNVVGLDLARLFVGSCGTLGIFTKLTLKLLPLPEGSATVLAAFPTLADALSGARGVFRAGILPTAMEFMDAKACWAVGQIKDVPWPKETQAVLVLKVDGSNASLAAELARLEVALAPAHPLCLFKGLGAQEEEPLWELRRLVSPAGFRLGPDKLGEDVAVPRGSTVQAVEGFQAMGAEQGVQVACYGHLGDGNIHVNIFYDASDADQRSRAQACKETVFRLTLSLGGTISGEHGTGITKGPYVSWQLGEEERALMAGIKNVFDPSGILNPGKGWS